MGDTLYTFEVHLVGTPINKIVTSGTPMLRGPLYTTMIEEALSGRKLTFAVDAPLNPNKQTRGPLWLSTESEKTPSVPKLKGGRLFAERGPSLLSLGAGSSRAREVPFFSA